MRVTPELLAALREYVDTVPDADKQHYSGFFWGQSDAEDWEQTRKMLPDLEYRIKSGEHIYYSSWW